MRRLAILVAFCGLSVSIAKDGFTQEGHLSAGELSTRGAQGDGTIPPEPNPEPPPPDPQIWDDACLDIEKLYATECLSRSSYVESQCKDRRKKAKKTKQIFYLEDIYWYVSYEKKRNRFKVEVPAMLYGTYDKELCITKGCELQAVTTKKPRVAKGRARYHQWEKRYYSAIKQLAKPAKTFYVSADEIKLPQEFEHQLEVSALVEVSGYTSLSAGDWFGLDTVQVRIVALRAMMHGTPSWSKVIIPVPKRLKLKCTVDGLR